MRFFKKWNRGDECLWIEIGHFEDAGETLIVDSNFLKPPLPIVEWRRPVPLSDEEDVERLVSSVARWAEEDGFEEVPVLQQP